MNVKDDRCTTKDEPLRLAMKCHSCRTTFTDPPSNEKCPQCGGNHISTWNYYP